MSFFGNPNISRASGTQLGPTPQAGAPPTHTPDDYRLSVDQLPLSVVSSQPLQAQNPVNVFNYGPLGLLTLDGSYSTLVGATQHLGDGSATALSAVYSTLAAAQAVYSFATALTQTVDYCAIQAATNAAGTAKKSLYGPAPSSGYQLGSSTWNITPASVQTFDITFDGGVGNINFSGNGTGGAPAAGGTVIYANNVKRSRWKGLHILLSGSAPSGLLVLDFDNANTATGLITFDDCDINSNNACTNVVGVRLDHSSSGNGSGGLNATRVNVSFAGASTGCIGWVNEGTNTLDMKWMACSVSNAAIGWTNIATAGGTNGGDAMFWHSCDGTSCAIDFQLTAGGQYGWFGGRWESGAQFLSINAGGGGAGNNVTLPIIGVEWRGYTTAIGAAFIDVESAGTLHLQDCTWTGPTNTVGASWITYKVGGGFVGNLTVKGCVIQNSDPFYTTGGAGTVARDITSNSIYDGAHVTGSFAVAQDAAATGNALPTDVQAFTASGTWTKPSGAPKTTRVIVIGAGGGGGSGRRDAAGTVRCGGGGGGAGGFTERVMNTATFGATEPVTVAAGATGGLAVAADTTNGNAGNNASTTQFGATVTAYALWANGGSGGGGGTNAAGTAGSGGSASSASGQPGGAAAGTGSTGSGGGAAALSPGGGGAGGGITSGNSASAGGAGGSGVARIAGGTAGAAGSVGGNGTGLSTNAWTPGGGGGGGGADTGTGGQAGGNGAAFGAGGGGGGASINGAASGAGGTGGGGLVVAITSY